jgi:Glycosyltransferase family 87
MSVNVAGEMQAPAVPRGLATRAREFASYTGHVYVWYALPFVVTGLALWYWARGAGTDFDANVWFPAKAVLHGESPYPQPELSALVGHATFLYPPPILLLDLPLAVFPHFVSRTLFWFLTIGSVAWSLWILGVRDRRIYLVALLAYPVWLAHVFGNPTLLLIVPLALAWRYRDDPWRGGLAVGCAIALKLIVWPLGLWLLATRRLRATAVAAGTSLVLVVTTWAAIGFRGLADYPHLLRMFSETTAAPRAFTITTLGTKIGIDSSIGRVMQLACGIALLGCVCVLARRTDGDRRAFSMAIVVALVISPVIEIWYLALLLVPLAIVQPTYSRVWGMVWLFWLFPIVPRGPIQVVDDHGVALHSLGRIPSVPQLCIAALFVIGLAYIITRAPGSPRQVRYPSRRPAAIV